MKGTEAVQDAIANGVSRAELAYVGRAASGGYRPFQFNKGMASNEVEISDDMFIITRETAEAYIKKREGGQITPPPAEPQGLGEAEGGGKDRGVAGGEQPLTPGGETGARGIRKIAWPGEIAPQKWMNFYTRVLSRFVTGTGLKVTVNVEVAPEEGVSKQKADETRTALRELGLNDNLMED